MELTLEEKIDFLSTVNIDNNSSFCAELADYCKINSIYHSNYKNIINDLFPELLQYKPLKVFYDYQGNIAADDSQFWFPHNEEGAEIRRNIVEELLITLNNLSNDCI